MSYSIVWKGKLKSVIISCEIHGFARRELWSWNYVYHQIPGKLYISINEHFRSFKIALTHFKSVSLILGLRNYKNDI